VEGNLRLFNFISYTIIFVSTSVVFLLGMSCGDQSLLQLSHVLTHLTGLFLLALAITLPLWRWLFRKQYSPALFCFALSYAALSSRDSVESMKELDRIGLINKESDLIAEALQNCPEKEALLREKNYTTEVYGEYASLLDYRRKTSLMFCDNERARSQAWDELNLSEMLVSENLASFDELCKSRTRLNDCYDKLCVLFRHSVNFSENHLRLLWQTKYTNETFMQALRQNLEKKALREIDYFYDVYNNNIDLIIAIDNLVYFMGNLENRAVENSTLIFVTDEEKKNFDQLYEQIFALANDEEAIVSRFNEASTLAIQH
jgi:hypothetical protein